MPGKGLALQHLKVGQCVLHVATRRTGVIIEVDDGLALVQFHRMPKPVWCLANKLRKSPGGD